ncbi:MAG: hypothetical protein M1838_005219 [Thelocarpon superellum]|nr:MAG: hypothetical protein M1838_005219 [Thelocarpon superellum]
MAWNHLHRSRPIRLLLFGVLASAVSRSTTMTSVTATSFIDPVAPSTCQSRTINYITHSLPQQCLAQTRTGPTAPGAAFPEVSPTAVESPSDEQTPHSSMPDVSGSSSGSSSQTTEQAETSTSTGASPASSTASSAPVVTDGEVEAESPFDDADFLSFEEWKKQNLARAGQSADLEEKRSASAAQARRRPGSIANALDALGDDAEIELDFRGFVGPTPGSDGPEEAASEWKRGGRSDEGRHEGETAEQAAGTGLPPQARLRSEDAGKTCNERFNYASFDCAATVLKTNPQCQSSSSILVENKDSYLLDECSAENKFVVVELCDIILVDTVVLANFEFFSSMFRTFRVSVSDRYPVKMDRWRDLGTFEARNSREVQAFLVESPLIWAKYLRIEFLTHFGNEYYCPVSLLRVHGTTMMEEFRHGSDTARGEEEIDDDESEEEERASENKTGPEILEPSQQPIHDEVAGMVLGTRNVEPPELPAANRTVAGDTCLLSEDPAHHIFSAPLPLCPPHEGISSDTHASTPTIRTSTVVVSVNTTMLQTSNPDPLPTSVVDGSGRGAGNDSTDTGPPSSTEAKSTPKAPSSDVAESTTKVSSSSTQPPSAMPTTQESFFKTIHKRLQLLESNSTLSLQYIEEQSRILRDAFTKVEKRQLAKTTTFLENLNATVLTELRGFRQQYDQIWQSTIIELETQREQTQREILAVTARLGILADEVIFQKRMSIVQSVLLLLCIALLIFSRTTLTSTSGTTGAYSDMPVPLSSLQTMLHLPRSSSSFKFPFESPDRRTEMALHSPTPELSPPTPLSLSARSESERGSAMHPDGEEEEAEEESGGEGEREGEVRTPRLAYRRLSTDTGMGTGTGTGTGTESEEETRMVL